MSPRNQVISGSYLQNLRLPSKHRTIQSSTSPWYQTFWISVLAFPNRNPKLNFWDGKNIYLSVSVNDVVPSGATAIRTPDPPAPFFLLSFQVPSFRASTQYQRLSDWYIPLRTEGLDIQWFWSRWRKRITSPKYTSATRAGFCSTIQGRCRSCGWHCD